MDRNISNTIFDRHDEIMTSIAAIIMQISNSVFQEKSDLSVFEQIGLKDR
jgi:hypothetical protein